MKPNRQKTITRPHLPPKQITQQIPTQPYFTNKNKPLYPNNTLSLQLLLQQSAMHQLTLNCDSKLSLRKQKCRGKFKKPSLNHHNNQQNRSTKYISVLDKSQHVMRKCLQQISYQPHLQFIFTTSHYQQQQPKHASTAKTKSFMQNIKQRGKIDANSLQKCERQSKQKENSQNYQQIKRHVTKKYQSETPQMFTVQEIVGQSIQEDIQESIHQQQHFKNKHFPQLNKQQHQHQHQQQINHSERQPFKPINNQIYTKPSINYFQDQQHIQKQDLNKQNELFNSIEINTEKPKDNHKIQKFSFARQIKQGIIEHEPLKKVAWESFKLIGDEQLEREKGRLKGLQYMPMMTQMGQQSEISSIISNTIKQDTHKRYELDSIKLDLQNYNTCCKKREEKVAQAQGEAASTKFVAGKGQQQINDLVQITQKSGQKNGGEFFVRYNVRFLQKTQKNVGSVMRISPLKFRRKEQLVRQLVQSKMIEKESNSICIS